MPAPPKLGRMRTKALLRAAMRPSHPIPVHGCRELTEFGRSLELPAWHGTERRHAFVWYNCVQRLRLHEVEEGHDIVAEGAAGDACYWLLTGGAEASWSAAGPRTAGGGGGAGAAAADGPVNAFQRFGQEALVGEPYTTTVKVHGRVAVGEGAGGIMYRARQRALRREGWGEGQAACVARRQGRAAVTGVGAGKQSGPTA
jgi:hypothetical protein